MNFDDFLSGAHDDKIAVLNELLGKLQEQIDERRVLTANAKRKRVEQLSELTHQILQLQSEGGMPDIYRQERMPLERERRELDRSIDLEDQLGWRDIQKTIDAILQLLRELREEAQRYERLRKVLSDPGPE